MKSDKYGMGCTTDGEYLYAIYGRSSNPHYITKSTRYNLMTDKWSYFHDNKTTKRFISAEYVGNKIYVLNGFNQDGSINRNVEVIDPQSGEVGYLSDNPSPVCYSGTAVWDDKIYVFGGITNAPRYPETTYTDQMYLFDPVNDQWTLLGVIPEHKHAQGEIVDGVLYVFGGYKGNNQVSTQIDAYDISDSTWYYIGKMPIKLSANAITKHGDFIWLVGDYNKLSLLAVFNTKTLKLHYIKSNILGRRHAGAEIVGNRLYVYGGNRTPGQILSSIQVADISEIENLLLTY
jgi:N-acetylneuraminic acid mutarotase